MIPFPFQAGGFGRAGQPAAAGGGGVTWNPADKSTFFTLSNGNRTATSTAGGHILVRATLARSSGKYYFEVSMDSANAGTAFVGLSPGSLSVSSNYPGNSSTSWGYLQVNGNKYTNATATAYGANYNGVVVVGVAVDLTAGLIWWSRANVWQASGDPAAGTGAAYSGLTGTLFPTLSQLETARVATGKFAAADLTYSPPSGFSAWDS